MKEKLLYIDHSFHRKSKATSFLIDLLKNHYDVTIVWEDAWLRGVYTSLKSLSFQDYHTIILFQQINFPKRQLKRMKGKNLILIPMYDGSGGLSDEIWKKFKNFKIVNFSKNFHIKLKRLGLVSEYFQYFPPVHHFQISKPDINKLSGFFWQRNSQITWKHIRELIKQSDFANFHIHGAVDPPGYPLVLPSKTEKKKYSITLSKWFLKRRDYFKVLNNANVYFAPRLNEGIGMSFLEAMAKGMCVVAPDKPTMNEYVIHGKTGLLYDPKNPKPLDFSNYKKIGINARAYIEKKHTEWIERKKEIIEFIKMPIHKPVRLSIPSSRLGIVFSIKQFIKEHFPRLGNILIRIKKRLKTE